MISKEFEATIAEALGLLAKNPEWEARYAGYAKVLLNRAPAIANRKKLFREFPPLRFYLRISDIKKAASYTPFDVRYRGQSVASMRVYDDRVLIDKTSTKNDQYFSTDETLAIGEAVDWSSEQASNLRRHFRDLCDASGKSPEHNIENLLLTEFSKKKREGKGVVGIQPVRYPDKDSGFRFAMPTPLKASKHSELHYSDDKGGGIDILARTSIGGGTRLTVIEVKDEYNNSNNNEPPTAAVKQAIAYATFVLKLLRSESGSDWWSIFGFGRALPASLTVNVACAMPHNPKGEDDVSFAGERLAVGNDFIECHFIYFDYDRKTNSLGCFRHSL